MMELGLFSGSKLRTKLDTIRDEITGKPVKDSDGKTVRLPSNYIERAGNTTYFDLGQDWEIQTKEYWLDRRRRAAVQAI